MNFGQRNLSRFPAPANFRFGANDVI